MLHQSIINRLISWCLLPSFKYFMLSELIQGIESVYFKVIFLIFDELIIFACKYWSHNTCTDVLVIYNLNIQFSWSITIKFLLQYTQYIYTSNVGSFERTIGPLPKLFKCVDTPPKKSRSFFITSGLWMDEILINLNELRSSVHRKCNRYFHCDYLQLPLSISRRYDRHSMNWHTDSIMIWSSKPSQR